MHALPQIQATCVIEARLLLKLTSVLQLVVPVVLALYSDCKLGTSDTTDAACGSEF